MKQRFSIIVLTLLLCATLSGAQDIDTARFQAHVQALTAAPHRMAGTPEGRKAGEYIESVLRDLPGQVFTQRFTFPQQISERCELRLASGAVVPMHPLMANGLQMSLTPRAGLNGRLVYVGMASGDDLAGKDLDGCIAVAEFAAADTLPNLFCLGVTAIIYVGPETPDRTAALDKRSYASINLPRFYVSRDTAARHGLLKAGEGTILSRGRWEKRAGCNLFLWIPGGDPFFKPFKQQEFSQPEYVILSASYDSAGIVPANSPSPERAANCAALLETARRLAANPPRRSVLIAFFDNHANFIEGGRQFYTALRRSIGEGLADPLPVRLQFAAQERAYLQELGAALDSKDLFASAHRLKDEVFVRLRDESRFQYDELQQRLSDLRLRRNGVKARHGDMAALDAEIEQKVALQRRWQLVRESVRDRQVPPPEALPLLQESLGILRAHAAVRLAELDDIEVQIRESQELTRALTCAPDWAAGAAYARGTAVSCGGRTFVCLADHSSADLSRPGGGAQAGSYWREISCYGTPVAHVAYRFSCGDTRWLFVPRGAMHARRYGALINQAQADLKPEAREAIGFVWNSRQCWESGGSAAIYNPLNVNDALEESCLGEPFQIPAMELVTEQDRMLAWDQPDAAFAPDVLDRIRRQAEGFLPFLDCLGREASLSAPNQIALERKPLIEEYQWEDNDANGHRVRSFPYGQTSAVRPEPGALVQVINNRKPRQDYYVYADGNGCFFINSLLRESQAVTPWRQMALQAATFDEAGSIAAITTAVPQAVIASVDAGWDKASQYMARAVSGNYSILTMFRGEKGEFLGRTLPFGEAFKPTAFRMLNGLANTVYPRVHFRYDPEVGVGVYYVERPLGVKLVYTDPRRQDEVALYINSHPEAKEPLGVGYGPGCRLPSAESAAPLDLHAALARDMFALNEHRLDRLRRKNIILNFYEDLHVQAKGLLASCDAARQTHRHRQVETLSAAAAALERRVYVPIISTTNDMVVAVTVLLLLTLPFAFSLQNLLLSTYNIYKKIGGFILIFIPTFLVLYFTHPAFSFAATPIIIFLAFFIIVMSGTVIYIISGKFFYEVKKLQGLAVVAHTFEKSFFGHLGSAVALAFSTMRRRPVRTALTIITVLLLTFTILSFAAFQSERGINAFYRGSIEGDQTSRALLHRRLWLKMDRAVLDDLEAYFGGNYAVHGRFWRVYELTTETKVDDLQLPVRNAAGRSFYSNAIFTLDPVEVEKVPAIRALLPGRIDAFNAGRGVYLSQTMARDLNLAPGDPVTVEGIELAFLGAFDSKALLSMHQIDNSPLLPVNYAMTKMAIGKFESRGSAQGGGSAEDDLADELAQLGTEALEPVAPDAVVLAPSRLARPLNMVLRGVQIYPKDPAQDLDQVGRALAVFNDDGAYLNKGGEVSFLFYGEKMGVSGARDIILPLILGGLIVFSTMLGSVIDREKEIYTFSALGLAPRNIAMLFFVEAGIYAVIGGFGGYMLGQVVTRVLEVLAAYGLFRAPEMNYSSSTAIITILIVMATVILSTIYPALQAARKATAETSKRWKIPAPKQSVLEFDFPFTISRYDITGIICFINEHFQCYADRTVGHFAAGDVQIFRESVHGMAGLSATIWLAPFDQGISQKFEITTKPSDILEVCEVHFRIERLSGPPSAWKRSNRVFLEDMRSQFLLWRTLDNDVREHYLRLAECVEKNIGVGIGAA